MHCISYELEISREKTFAAILGPAKSTKFFNFKNFRLYSRCSQQAWPMNSHSLYCKLTVLAFALCTDSHVIIPREARFLLGLSRDRMASAHTFRVASKRSFLLVRESQVPSLALRLTNMDGYLQENIECLRAHRFAGFASSCSKVRVGFKSSYTFPIIFCGRGIFCLNLIR